MKIFHTFTVLFILFSLIGFSQHLMKILDTGNMSIGIRNIPSEVVYFPSNKEKTGFCYEIATEFAKISWSKP
ncbi:hypothetical protein [Thermosipho japonicus]|uniref:hypothetical protein n=1 Tax=Thermosipho japonicus TaxID=90323 RepID=UPI00161B457C|nr:hypothetical protein [Thermosipho japonicus]